MVTGTAVGTSKPVEDVVESLTRGNVTEVKVVLASVVLALACYVSAIGLLVVLALKIAVLRFWHGLGGELLEERREGR
jgi:hypothetical protein